MRLQKMISTKGWRGGGGGGQEHRSAKGGEGSQFCNGTVMGFLGAGVKLVSITDYKTLQSMNPRLETGLQIQQPKSYPYIFDSEEVLSASERLTLLREMCGPFLGF